MSLPELIVAKKSWLLWRRRMNAFCREYHQSFHINMFGVFMGLYYIKNTNGPIDSCNYRDIGTSSDIYTYYTKQALLFSLYPSCNGGLTIRGNLSPNYVFSAGKSFRKDRYLDKIEAGH